MLVELIYADGMSFLVFLWESCLRRKIQERLNEAMLLLQITLMRLLLKFFITIRCLYFRKDFVKMRNNNGSYLNNILLISMPCTGGINDLFNLIRKDEVSTWEREREKSRNYFQTAGEIFSFACKRHSEIY